MKAWKISSTVVLLLIVISSCGAVDVLYCPGQTVELSCRNPGGVVWQGTAFTGQCENDNITVSAALSAVGNTVTCGTFTANVTSLTPGTFVDTVDVNLIFQTNVSLNGTTVLCEDSDLNAPLIVDQLLDIPATTTPTLMLSQNSQSMVGVAFVIDDPRCVANYSVNVTQEGGPTTSVSGLSSPVMVGGLDLCLYRYRSVGYTTSMTGEVSEVSASVNLTVNLTAINGVNVTVSLMDPVIEWTQIDRTLYPTCITGYIVANQGDTSINTTVDSTVTSLTTQQLNAAGFPYCISVQATVTPRTPMGDLATAVGSSISLMDPDFPSPMLTCSFNLSTTNVVVLRVNIQNLTGSFVETTTYSYTFNGTTMSSPINFTGDYFEIELAGAEGGEQVAVSVEFVYGQCMSSMTADFTVPGKSITGIIQGPTTDTSHNVTITLPLTPYQPEELLIISTVEPDSIAALVANFSRPGMQYSVTFNNLMADTSYNFTIRIVLRANTTVDVVQPAMGLFMTLITPTATPPPTTMAPTTTSTQAPSQPTGAPLGGCTEGCIAGIIVGFLFVLVLVVVIVVVVLCYWSKTRKSGGMKVSHEMEEQSDKLTPSHGDQVDPVSDSLPTETFKNPDAAVADKSPDVIPGNEDADAGPDSNALIYADLEMATKGKNKAKVDATVTPTGGAEGHEAVEYASIEHFKKSDKSEGDEDN